MHKVKNPEIILGIIRINNNYGRGSVQAVYSDDSSETKGTVERMIPTTQHTGFLETRVFRIDDKFTLHYLGHTQKLPITQKNFEKLYNLDL